MPRAGVPSEQTHRMLGRIGVWRHVLVAITVLFVAALATFGLVGQRGEGVLRPESFDAKQVIVLPASALNGDENALVIREVVDIDFGVHRRRGYQRIIPNDFGTPTRVTASSPTGANDEVNIAPAAPFETRIRVGNPDITFTGQHRYILTYVLPRARLSTGRLELDIIGTEETFKTERFTVVVTGFELANRRCDTGGPGATGGCELVPIDGGYQAVIEPLEPGEGISIFADIVDRTPVRMPDPPPLPDEKQIVFPVQGVASGVIGAVTGIAIFVLSRRAGRNEVFGAGGAADAAFGALPQPNADGTVDRPPTMLVPDDRMDELATVEFVPPAGIDPWQGQVLLREKVDDSTVSAWFSGMAAKDAIVLSQNGKKLVMATGASWDGVDAADRAHLQALFGSAPSLELGTYDPQFTATWNKIRGDLGHRVHRMGWWKHMAPGGSIFTGDGAPRIAAWAGITVLIFIATVVSLFFGSSGWSFMPYFLAVLLPAMIALGVYRTLLPARSGTGSALALRTESFRRFLEASEGQHVEWAWEHGLLREYSAWAVALGAADAWDRALRRANIPPEQVSTYTAPLLVHSMASSLSSSRVDPSSSSSGGGGGVGGGGGGGSSGSW